MKYLYVEPEVSASFGDNTVLDTRVHPPIVSALHLQFEGWLGDCLIECFPCFILTEQAKVQVELSKLSGVHFADVIITRSEIFDELYPQRQLPNFYWAQICGVAGEDDFGVAKDYRLVISDRAFKLLSVLGVRNAIFSDFNPPSKQA